MNQPIALIVDDNNKNVSVLSHMLSNEGLGTLYIKNPLELAQTPLPIDDIKVVFLDLEMPNTNGYQLLSYFKAQPQFQAVPIIAYTVHVSEIQEAVRKGFDGFLGKPLDSDKFPEQLARILNGESVWETP